MNGRVCAWTCARGTDEHGILDMMEKIIQTEEGLFHVFQSERFEIIFGEKHFGNGGEAIEIINN